MGWVKTWKRAFWWWYLAWQYHKKTQALRRKERYIEQVTEAYFVGDITEDEYVQILKDKGIDMRPKEENLA